MDFKEFKKQLSKIMAKDGDFLLIPDCDLQDIVNAVKKNMIIELIVDIHLCTGNTCGKSRQAMIKLLEKAKHEFG